MRTPEAGLRGADTRSVGHGEASEEAEGCRGTTERTGAEDRRRWKTGDVPAEEGWMVAPAPEDADERREHTPWSELGRETDERGVA